MLNRKTETKYIGNWITTTTLPNGVAPFAGPAWENATQALGSHDQTGAQYWSVALPAMVQGITDIARIGDKIEPTAHRVKMTLRLARTQVAVSEDNPSFGVTATSPVAQQLPLDVTAYIFYGYVKSLKTYQGSAASSYLGNSVIVSGQNEATRAMQKLLDLGDTNFASFTGSQEYAQLPLSSYVNMKVKKVHFRQGAGWINSAAGLTGALDPVGNTAADNTIMKQVTLKYKPLSKLAYKTSTDIYPENYAPVFAVGYVYNDATASQNQTTPTYGNGAIEYIAQSQLWFKDHQ